LQPALARSAMSSYCQEKSSKQKQGAGAARARS
jgi:hypothetical protein